MTVFADQLRPGLVIQTSQKTVYEVVDIMPIQGGRMMHWRWLSNDSRIRQAFLSPGEATIWGETILSEPQYVIEEF